MKKLSGLFAFTLFTASSVLLSSVGVADEPSVAATAPSAATVYSKVTRKDAEESLNVPCPEIGIHRDASLGSVLQMLHEHMFAETGIPVVFVVDQVELDLEAIASLDEVLLPELTLHAGTHSCKDVLDLLMKATVDPGLAYIPADGHILITTKTKADESLETRIYDVTAFLPALVVDKHTERPSRKKKGGKKSGRKAAEAKNAAITTQFGSAGGGMGGLGSGVAQGAIKQQAESENQLSEQIISLMQLISEQTEPSAKWMETHGEGGTMSTYGQYLAIRQTYEIHQHIESLLAQLQKAINTGGPLRFPTPDASQQMHGFGTPGYGGLGYGGLGGGGLGGGSGQFSIPELTSDSVSE